MANNETSIKEMLLKIMKQGLSVPDIQAAIVIKEKPLTLRLVNDKKITLTSDDLVIPERMTNHTITVSPGGFGGNHIAGGAYDRSGGLEAGAKGGKDFSAGSTGIPSVIGNEERQKSNAGKCHHTDFPGAVCEG